MQKTHRMVANPEIHVPYLADYMAASDQVRRGIVQRSKFKSLARLLQHKIARKTLTDHLEEGNPLPGDLFDKAEQIRNMLADSDFEYYLFEHNADFVKSFADNSDDLDFSGFDLASTNKAFEPQFNGTRVRFQPSLLTFRTTKANTQKIGGIMFRYSKTKAVSEDVAGFQAAFMFGFFRENPFYEEAKPESALCLVLDAKNGKTYPAPAKPIYKFNEMKAVCSDISEKWDNVPPPNGAVF